MDAPEPVEKLSSEGDFDLDDKDKAQAFSTSQHVKVKGEGVNLEELCKLDGRGTEFEVEYEVPEVEETNNYFDGEELFQNLNYDALDMDSDGEEDGLTTFQRLAHDMDSVTPDRGIIKKIRKQGSGQVVPAGSSVTVHYNCYIEDCDEPYDSTRLRNKPQKFVLGGGSVIPFLDTAVGTMRKGEISRYLIKPEYGFGKMGIPPRIPGNANILAEVELISFTDHVLTEEHHTWTEGRKKDLPFKAILKEVKQHREEGNDLFKDNLYSKAKHKYQKAERLLEDAHLKDQEDEDEMNKVLLKVVLNLALCFLKLKEPTRALRYSKKALELEPKNHKALYRCGKALYQICDFEKAKKYLLEAKRQCPESQDVIGLLAKLEVSMKKFRMMETNMYTNMFPGWRDVKGDQVKSNGNAKKDKSCSEEFQSLMTQTIKDFKDNDDLQAMPIAVDIRTEEEIGFIKSAALEMGLEVKAFSQSGKQDKYLKLIKTSKEEE